MPSIAQGDTRSFNTPRLLVGLVVVALGLYVLWSSSQRPAGNPENSPAEVVAPLEQEATPSATTSAKKIQTEISGVTVRDQNRKVIFRGTVDVGPTLARIERGEKLRFSHDGSVFENRERRLPTKPSGYYREYVHPTSGQDGPGPQRIVLGKAGESYYTSDHYRTFQRLDPK